jgi:CheY-like chemotaxis protein
VTILYVDDDENDRFFFRRSCEKVPVRHECIYLDNGLQARQYLEGVGEYECRKRHPFPDAIISDVKMPGMNGLELLSWIRAHPKFRSLPVFLFSSAAIDEEVREARRLGANAYFEKSPEGRNGHEQIGRILEIVSARILEAAA